MGLKVKAIGLLGVLWLSAAALAQPAAPAPAPVTPDPAAPAAKPAPVVNPGNDRAAKLHKAVEQLLAESRALDKFEKDKAKVVPLNFSRPHPLLKDMGPEYAIDALQRMLQPMNTGPGAEFRDAYVRWHLMWVAKKASDADRAETGSRLMQLVKKMPGDLNVQGKQVYRHEPEEIYAKYVGLANSGNTVVGYKPFERYIGPPESYKYFDAAKVAQVKANLEEAAKLKDKFKTIVDEDAAQWNQRVNFLNYIVRQYRGELIYALLLTGDPEMARTVMGEVDRLARAKNGVAFDLLAYFYLAAFDGAMSHYDQNVLVELSKKLEATARATEGYVSYGGAQRNFADYAFHLIYMLQDGGGFIEAKEDPTPRRKLPAP
jgi:hypothetical protein